MKKSSFVETGRGSVKWSMKSCLRVSAWLSRESEIISTAAWCHRHIWGSDVSRSVWDPEKKREKQETKLTAAGREAVMRRAAAWWICQGLMSELLWHLYSLSYNCVMHLLITVLWTGTEWRWWRSSVWTRHRQWGGAEFITVVMVTKAKRFVAVY